MKLKLGEHVIAKEMHQMVYILMLLWQHTQFQIAIMHEWLPLYLILSKHSPLKGAIWALHMLTTVFLDSHLSKRNFRQSHMLSTDRIEIHQSQPASMT